MAGGFGATLLFSGALSHTVQEEGGASRSLKDVACNCHHANGKDEDDQGPADAGCPCLDS